MYSVSDKYKLHSHIRIVDTAMLAFGYLFTLSCAAIVARYVVSLCAFNT